MYSCAGNVCTSTATALYAGSTGETIIVTATINASATVMRNVAYVSPGARDVNEKVQLVIPSTDTNTTESVTNNDAEAGLILTPFRLPATGGNSFPLLYSAAGMLCAGGLARVLGRRRRLVAPEA
jgi:LPXTG-motif cell wall-anchored protein